MMPDETQPVSSASEASTVTENAAALLVSSEVEKQQSRSSLQSIAENSILSSLPLQLDVTVPIPSFRVQDLLSLEKGSVLESRWPHAEDVPVWCGGSQLMWSEFEMVGQKLAVRVTRIG